MESGTSPGRPLAPEVSEKNIFLHKMSFHIWTKFFSLVSSVNASYPTHSLKRSYSLYQQTIWLKKMSTVQKAIVRITISQILGIKANIDNVIKTGHSANYSWCRGICRLYGLWYEGLMLTMQRGWFRRRRGCWRFRRWQFLGGTWIPRWRGGCGKGRRWWWPRDVGRFCFSAKFHPMWGRSCSNHARFGTINQWQRESYH